MKKALLVLAALCVAGVFSAKAQSPSDSAYARDLSYTFINMSNLPATATGDLVLSSGGKILKDIRVGRRAKGYAITVSSSMTIDIQLVSGSGGWDSYLYLLDANFNQIAYNDDWGGPSNGSRITTNVNAGQYYILVSEYSLNTSATTRSFTLTIDQITVTPLNQLTYTPVSLPTMVQDTFQANTPDIIYNNNIYKAKGYSFQGTQGKFLWLDSISNISNGILLDNNFNEIPLITSNLRFSYTGTYYLVALCNNTTPKPFTCKLEQIEQQTIYVDGVNGSDSRNGLTPQTAVFTLDTAIARTHGIGKYYITDDYTFSNDDPLEINYAEIYPYQKDIKLKIASSDGEDVISAFGYLVFGEQGSSYYFIIDSNRNGSFDDFLDAGYYGSYLEVNNLKITNSYFPSTAFWCDNFILRNCEFTNDTVEDYFIDMEQNYSNSVKFINCNISQNFFNEDFIYSDYDSAKVTFENTTVAGNTFNDYPCIFYGGATVNLTSGSWRNNRCGSSSGYPSNGNPNITAQTGAGIWIFESTVNIGAGFSMEANNYLCIDSATTVNVNQNPTAHSVATIYPMKWDDNTSKYIADYYEGRLLLQGSAVAANYTKFGVAQADNSSLWYLHSDGKIYTTEQPVGINTAAEGTISLYPNPATDVLNITLQSTEVNEVAVIDIYGKTALRANVAEGGNTLDISALPAGMYFVQLRNGGSIVATNKIIKK